MKELRILFLGDIVGQPGLRALFAGLADLRGDTRADVVAVNGENVADGYGLTPDLAENLFSSGVEIITTGNHIWQREEIFPLLGESPKILRPLNYPVNVPGHGTAVVDVKGIKVGFINALGQNRMGMTVDCPFRTVRKAASEMRRETKNIILDFHAEDVREKEGMFHHVDGLVSAVIGTHTHVTTADERILPGGTAVITDVGMCGPVDSVIGTVPAVSIRRSLTQLPLRMVVSENTGEIRGVLISLNPENGKALDIQRIRWPREGQR